MYSNAPRALMSVAVLCFALLALPVSGQHDARSMTLAQGDEILAGVTLESSVPLSDLVASLDEYDGELVQVEGTVVALCQMMGCWATIDDGDGNRINVKVEDGVIDLREMAATEHYIVADGIVQKTGEHGAQIWIMDHGARIWSGDETD